MEFSSNTTQLILDIEDLATLPDIYMQLRKVLDDPESSMHDLSKVILSDPVVTANILKIANSAFFGFASKIDTVSRAINLLGSQQTHDLTLAMIVADKFNSDAIDFIDMDEFWYNSVHCGIVARIIAKRCNVLDCERLFVEGLLHNIGHLVLYMKQPFDAKKAKEQFYNDGKYLYKIERSIMGFDYAEIGSALMQNWGLPLSIQTSIRYHTEPSKSDDFHLECSIIHLANIITLAAEHPVIKNNLLESIDSSTSNYIELNEDDIGEVIKEADPYINDLITLMFGQTKRSA
jgi:HD-like signal output (HDOD) protein